MSPVNFCFTVALVTFGPAPVPAGFSCQSLISKPPLAIFFNVGTSFSGLNRSSPPPAPVSPCGGEDVERILVGAGDRPRTGYLNLGKVALYQVSYARAPVDFTFR